MRRSALLGTIAAGALVLTGCVGAGPSPETIAAEFATPIEPVWEVDIPGLYGEPVLRDGVVLAYADDDEVGMRLTAHSLDDGELLWEHTSSPAGAYANPILVSQSAASRPYPLPTISPLVIETGEGAAPAVVFFEREIPDDGSITPDDFLRVADLQTGELLEVATPEFDPEAFTFEPVGRDDDDDIFANTSSPGLPCGDEICWVATDAEADRGSATIRLDPATLEARYVGGLIPDTGETVSHEWGLDYARVSEDGVEIARFDDGEELWRADTVELFGVERTSPPDYVGVVEVGDLVLMQGYQPLLETLDYGLPHTLSIDYAESRTLIAVDAETGEVVWRVPGGDMLCHAVHERPIPRDATTIPICLATGGGFVFNLGTEQMDEQEDIAASISELTVADGELGWEVEGAGVVSIAHVTRMLAATYAARGDLAVVDDQEAGQTLLVDLRDGASYPMPDEGAAYVCKAERADVELEFEGSIFASGSNPITTGYPAGWYHFPCDDEGAESDVWMKGAVRVAGYPAGDSRVVLPLEGSLVAFDL